MFQVSCVFESEQCESYETENRDVISNDLAFRCGPTVRGKARPKYDFAAYFKQVEKGKRVQTGGLQDTLLKLSPAPQSTPLLFV